MNNPIRAAHQHRREAEWFKTLSGQGLTGERVLEIGSGRGVGVEVILDRLGAGHVTALDVDPEQVERARRRLRGRSPRSFALGTGDAASIEAASGSFDAVVDFGILHHVPRWRDAVAEIGRVLRPGGRLLFEQVPRHVLDTWAFRTFTEHPRADRFEAAEFTAELARVGLHGSGQLRTHVGGMVFVGSAVRPALTTCGGTLKPRSGRWGRIGSPTLDDGARTCHGRCSCRGPSAHAVAASSGSAGKERTKAGSATV
jgi:SAM-dependent methyltransferase